jgi:hypothetical protein
MARQSRVVPGQQFGRLSVVELHERKSSRDYWLCQCDCGNTSIVANHSLVTGATRSCGCLNKKAQRDRAIASASKLIGKRFGRLEVVRVATERDPIELECICDCGSHHFARKYNLMRGSVSSCGCLRKETSEKCLAIGHDRDLREDLVEGTNLASISPERKINKNNKSGARGVCFNSKRGMWRASITFQRRHIYLGCHQKIEDAMAARRKAEKLLFDPVLRKHGKEYRE